MKTINKLLAICFIAIVLMAVKPAKTFAQFSASISFQTFYDDLQPYGTWVEDPDYGDVWIPDADEGFKPYATRGHWVVTRYGNTWVSDYPWGWAAFHYGRWRYDDYYGWEWIPGDEWGPAWVNWRSGGGYYAWAPLAPGISIDISFGSGYRVPNDYWVCAPQAYICDPHIYNYYVPRTRVVNVINQTTIINNTYIVNNNTRYIAGPRVQDIQRVSRTPVRVYNVGNGSDPRRTVINNNTVNIYRPAVIRNAGNNGNRPRPATVVDGRAYKQANPNAGIAHRTNYGATINHDNAARLAQTARNPNPQNQNVVRFNRRDGNNANPGNTPVVSPGMHPNNDRRNPANNSNGQNPNAPVVQPQMRNGQPAQQGQPQNDWRGRNRDQRQPQNPAQPQPADQRVQSAQQGQPQNDWRGRNRDQRQPQNPAQQQPADQQRVQQEQQRQQQLQQRQQAEQQRQQQLQQRQQQDQQRVQQQQQRQQAEQQRQQQLQQRQQADQQRQQQLQQRQQAEQQRQQQLQQRQQIEQQRQQVEQQRQQQAQQRQQMEQQRQQQAQQRQQMEQQRQQQTQPPPQQQQQQQDERRHQRPPM